ncbi:unnamed protein product, partial [Brachionus calyciflorus]
MLRHWSLDSLSDRQFIDHVNFTDKVWKLASEYLYGGKSVIRRLGNFKIFVLTEKEFINSMNADYLYSSIKKVFDCEKDAANQKGILLNPKSFMCNFEVALIKAIMHHLMSAT